MIDTVSLGKWVEVNLTDIELTKIGWIRMPSSHNGLNKKFILNGVRNSYSPRLTLTQNIQWKWYLRAEVSIPSWLFGTNAKLPNQKDIYSFLENLSDYVSEKGKISFDAFSAKVRRVDFTKDLLLGRENIVPTIRSLLEVIIPKFRRVIYDEQTVEYSNRAEKKGKSIKVYDKLVEMNEHKKEIPDDLAIKDLLRLEISYRSPHFIETLKIEYKLPDVLAETVLQVDIAKSEIMKASKLLNLNKEITDKINLFEKLIAKNGLKRGITLFGFVKALNVYGQNFHKFTFLNYSRRTYQDNWKKIMASGGFCL